MAKLLETVAYRNKSPHSYKKIHVHAHENAYSKLALQPPCYIQDPVTSRRRLPTWPITTRHLVLRLSLSKLLPSLVAEPSHLSVFATQALGVVRRPANMSFVEDIRPLRVVFLLFALCCHCVHEILLVIGISLSITKLNFSRMHAGPKGGWFC
jgi:hypothetical protein